jgi:hypothetical protein
MRQALSLVALAATMAVAMGSPSESKAEPESPPLYLSLVPEPDLLHLRG